MKGKSLHKLLYMGTRNGQNIKNNRTTLECAIKQSTENCSAQWGKAEIIEYSSPITLVEEDLQYVCVIVIILLTLIISEFSNCLFTHM